ncbi:MAG TPA: hypothetical protein VMZ50_13840, partial [Phycisphaerae bacterium]|nr:hypothetical protein [Phycisphaerae bacterium]
PATSSRLIPLQVLPRRAGPQPALRPSTLPSRGIAVTGDGMFFAGGIVLSGSNDFALARNYWQAGQEYYGRNDFGNAASALERVRTLAPNSPEAANASRLLSNIRMAQGQLTLESRGEKAAAAKVQSGISAQNRYLLQTQQKLLEEGTVELRAGRTGSAALKLEAAEALSHQLTAQGESQTEQRAVMREATEKLKEVRRQQKAQTAEVREKVRSLKGSGKYDEAMELAKRLPQAAPDDAAFQDELDELAVLAAVEGRTRSTRGWIDTGRKAMDELEYDKAVERFNKALELAPGNEEASGLLKHARALREVSATGRRILTHYDTNRRITRDVDADTAPRVERPRDAEDSLLRRLRGGPGETTMPQPTAKPAPPREDAGGTLRRVYDVNALVTRGSLSMGGGGGGDATYRAPTDEETRRENERIARALAGVDVAGGGKDGGVVHAPVHVSLRSGNTLVVTGTEQQQEVIADLLKKLGEARGPQVQLGTNIARQRAEGLGVQSGPARLPPVDSDGQAADGWKNALADNAELKEFIERNYDWVLEDRRAAAATPLPSVSGRALTQKLRINLGQKVTVQSINVNADAGAAAGMGVRFQRGNNGVVYALADEGQIRTLLALAAQTGATSGRAPANERRQDTIVGTAALLANGMLANVTYAADTGNSLVINGNAVAVPHQQYVLINNGRYLTALRAGPMQHWTQGPAPVRFAEVTPEIDVPRVGRLVKFEKTLVQPTDQLVLRAEYVWEGAAR